MTHCGRGVRGWIWSRHGVSDNSTRPPRTSTLARLFLASSFYFGGWTWKQTDCLKSRSQWLLIYSVATDSLSYLDGRTLLVSESFLIAFSPDEGMFPHSCGAVQILGFFFSISIYHQQLRTSGILPWRVTVSFDPNNTKKVCLKCQKLKTKLTCDVGRDCGDAFEAELPSCCDSLFPHNWTIMVCLFGCSFNSLQLLHAWTTCSSSSKWFRWVWLCRKQPGCQAGAGSRHSFLRADSSNRRINTSYIRVWW